MAFIDNCNVCSEGSTGHVADSDIDCAGVCFGEAFENDCGCVSGSTNLDVDYCFGCTDTQAWNCPTCPDSHNGNPNATVEDGSCIYPPDGWSFEQSTLQAFYFIAEADIDGISLEEGDWIGVFNEDVCAGFWPWEGPFTAIPAMGDDGENYSDGYFNVGDLPSFKIYDNSVNSIFSAMPSEEITWSNNGLSTLEFITGFSSISYSIDLHYGANLVSFPALPEDPSIGNVMISIEETVDGVIGEGVAANLLPNGLWVGSLNTISRTSGYWVKQTASDSLDVIGLPSDDDLLYDLHYGANLISYPFMNSAALESTLPSSVYENITGIIGEGVAATLLPNGQWAGSLDELEGKKGYWFIATDAFDFSYIPPNSNSRLSTNDEVLTLDEFSYSQSTKQAFYFVDQIEGAEEGDWIISYFNNQVIGARQWNGQIIDIPTMGYDGQFETVNYPSADDEVSFKIFKVNSQELISLDGEYDLWNDLNISFIDDLRIRKDIANEFKLSSIYPNPFNPVTSIEFLLDIDSDVELSIYDVNGRLVDVLFSNFLSAGSHTYEWNASNQSSGLYIVNLKSNNKVYQSKIMLIK